MILKGHEKQIAELHLEIEKVRHEIYALREVELERERKNFRWGITTLGSFIAILGGIIWTNLGSLIR